MSDEHVATDEHGAHDAHHVNYMYIFYALCVLTGLSVLADLGGKLFSHAPEAAVPGATAEAAPHPAEHGMSKTGKIVVGLIVLTVACFKATFVMLYFMHLKFEGKWKYVLLAPTMILALAIIAALTPDIGVHYYTVQTPQTLEAGAEEGHPGAAAPHGTHPAPPPEGAK